VSRLQALRRLDRADRRVLLRAWGWLLLVQVALPVAGYARTRRWLRRLGPGPAAASPARLAWLTRQAGRALPRPPGCLARAMVVESLLRRAGYRPELRFGVRAAAGGGPTAHAWVELDGQPVGDAGAAAWLPLAAADPPAVAEAVAGRGYTSPTP
jgi:hypothetical protein